MNKKLIPVASPGQKKEIDILMQEMGISSLQTNELAGRNVARLASKLSKGPFIIFIGKGNKSSVALIAAKNLINWNYPAAIILVEDEKKLSKEEKSTLKTLKYMRASIFRYGFPDMQKITSKANLIIEGLDDFSIKNNSKLFNESIIFINKQKKKILAIDSAANIDVLTGESHKPNIIATHTLALGICLKGITNNKNSGKLFVSDIGIPDSIYHAAGLEIKPRFHKKEILKL